MKMEIGKEVKKLQPRCWRIGGGVTSAWRLEELQQLLAHPGTAQTTWEFFDANPHVSNANRWFNIQFFALPYTSLSIQYDEAVCSDAANDSQLAGPTMGVIRQVGPCPRGSTSQG